MMTKKQTNAEPKKRTRKPMTVGKAIDKLRALRSGTHDRAETAAKKAANKARDRVYASAEKEREKVLSQLSESDRKVALAAEGEYHVGDYSAVAPPATIPDWATAEPEPLQAQEVERG